MSPTHRAAPANTPPTAGTSSSHAATASLACSTAFPTTSTTSDTAPVTLFTALETAFPTALQASLNQPTAIHRSPASSVPLRHMGPNNAFGPGSCNNIQGPQKYGSA